MSKISILEQAVRTGKLPQPWNVTRKDWCSKKRKKEMHYECETGESFQLSATYKNKSGASLIFRGIEGSKASFSAYELLFSTKLDGKAVTLKDIAHYDPKAPGSTKYKPEGELSPDDEIIIIEGNKGFFYYLHDKGSPVMDGSHKEFVGKGIVVLVGHHGEIYEGDPSTTAPIAITYNTPFHGLEFKREGGQWKFIGPSHRAEQGKEAEALLNSLASAYSMAVDEVVEQSISTVISALLDEAAKHISR